jgi:hypothetical protein
MRGNSIALLVLLWRGVHADAKADAASAAALVQQAKADLAPIASAQKVVAGGLVAPPRLDAAVATLTHAAMLDPKGVKECVKAGPIYRRALALRHEYILEQQQAEVWAWEANPDREAICAGATTNRAQQENCAILASEDRKDRDTYQPKADAMTRQAKETWAEAMKGFRDAARLCPDYYATVVPSGPPVY